MWAVEAASKESTYNQRHSERDERIRRISCGTNNTTNTRTKNRSAAWSAEDPSTPGGRCCRRPGSNECADCVEYAAPGWTSRWRFQPLSGAAWRHRVFRFGFGRATAAVARVASRELLCGMGKEFRSTGRRAH